MEIMFVCLGSFSLYCAFCWFDLRKTCKFRKTKFFERVNGKLCEYIRSIVDIFHVWNRNRRRRRRDGGEALNRNDDDNYYLPIFACTRLHLLAVNVQNNNEQ